MTNMVKCPKCGAQGNKLKNVRFMNFCSNCADGGLFYDDKSQVYDDKSQVYRYDERGTLRKIGRPGVL